MRFWGNDTRGTGEGDVTEDRPDVGTSWVGRRVSVLVTVILAISAAISVGYRLSIAASVDDNEALESVLLLPIARQLTAGPSELYGPFGRDNPLVLIHPPLYYRISALGAWILARTGLDPIPAAMAAARALAFLSFLGLLVASARLARLDGAPARVGWWAALMIAGSYAFGTFAIAARPDTLGLALQTLGIVLTLSAVCGEARRSGRVLAAYAAFALAFCVKQSLVASAVVSTVLLATAAVRGRLPAKAFERGVIVALAVTISIYGADYLVTNGRTIQAVFITAAEVSRVRPADQGRVEVILFELAAWSAGLFALFLAAGLAMVASRPGWLRRAFVATAGTAAAVMMLILIWQCQYSPPNQLLLTGGAAGMSLLLVVCALIEPRVLLGGRLDAALWAYWAAEFALTVVLCRSSTGSWTNYAIQGIVLGGILTARALSRALDRRPPAFSLIPAAVALVLVLRIVVADVLILRDERRLEYRRFDLVFRILGNDRRDFFFVDNPGVNRVHGRVDLVYDPWLYPVFEVSGGAQRRSTWLGPILESGAVRYVISRTDSPRIDGVAQTLPELGYRVTSQINQLNVWEHASSRNRHN